MDCCLVVELRWRPPPALLFAGSEPPDGDGDDVNSELDALADVLELVIVLALVCGFGSGEGVVGKMV